MNGSAPAYLCDLLSLYVPSRHLRSENKVNFVVPKTKLKTFGDKAFSVCAPRLWNSLPLYLKTAASLNDFKSLLKTYLFTDCYSSVSKC